MEAINKTVNAVSDVVNETLHPQQREQTQREEATSLPQPIRQPRGPPELTTATSYPTTRDGHPIPTTTNTVSHFTPDAPGFGNLSHEQRLQEEQELEAEDLPYDASEEISPKDTTRTGAVSGKGGVVGADAYITRKRADSGFADRIAGAHPVTGSTTAATRHQDSGGQMRYGAEMAGEDGISRTGAGLAAAAPVRGDPSRYTADGFPRQRYVGNETRDEGIRRADGRENVQFSDGSGGKGLLRPSNAGVEEARVGRTAEGGDEGVRDGVAALKISEPTQQRSGAGTRAAAATTGVAGAAAAGRAPTAARTIVPEDENVRFVDQYDDLAGNAAHAREIDAQTNINTGGGRNAVTTTTTSGAEGTDLAAHQAQHAANIQQKQEQQGTQQFQDQQFTSHLQKHQAQLPVENQQQQHVSIKSAVPPVTPPGATASTSTRSAGGIATDYKPPLMTDLPDQPLPPKHHPVGEQANVDVVSSGGAFPGGTHAPSPHHSASPQATGSGDAAAGGGAQEPGHLYIRSTGLAAEGGDFDAARPGAGKEADRLLEEHGIIPTTTAKPPLPHITGISHAQTHDPSTSKHTFLPSVPILHSHHASVDSGGSQRDGRSGSGSAGAGGGLLGATARNPVMGSTAGGGGGVPGVGSGVVGTQAPGPAKKFSEKLGKVIHH